MTRVEYKDGLELKGLLPRDGSDYIMFEVEFLNKRFHVTAKTEKDAISILSTYTNERLMQINFIGATKIKLLNEFIDDTNRLYLVEDIDSANEIGLLTYLEIDNYGSRGRKEVIIHSIDDVLEILRERWSHFDLAKEEDFIVTITKNKFWNEYEFHAISDDMKFNLGSLVGDIDITDKKFTIE